MLNFIACPNCGEDVRTDAPACPNCKEKIYVEHPGDIKGVKHPPLDDATGKVKTPPGG